MPLSSKKTPRSPHMKRFIGVYRSQQKILGENDKADVKELIKFLQNASQLNTTNLSKTLNTSAQLVSSQSTISTPITHSEAQTNSTPTNPAPPLNNLAVDVNSIKVSPQEAVSADEKISAKEQWKNQQLNIINPILVSLEEKIGQIEQHIYVQAYQAAQSLLSQLKAARDELVYNIENDIMMLNDSGYLFQSMAKLAIKQNKKILENDLGWGKYLYNLLISLCNTTIEFFTGSQSFFSTYSPESIKAVQTTEKALKELVFESNVI